MRVRRFFVRAGLVVLALVAVLAVVIGGAVAFGHTRTQATLAALTESLGAQITAAPVRTAPTPEALAALPEPVQRYVAFAFPDGIPESLPRRVRMTLTGSFRRPLTQDFHPANGTQTLAIGTPAFVFSETVTIPPGMWAVAMDAFVDGHMDMKAKILSTLTVVDEVSTPDLDRTSLRRWLLEAPLFPPALLPGGPVRWEAIDTTRARAVVTGFGNQASMVATFGTDGRLLRFDAEEDGDLTTPYHGSGESAARSGYSTVDGMRIPHAFSIARTAGGETKPFWTGNVTSIAFD